MIAIAVDTAKITRLRDKFQKYGPYALKQGLKASSDYLNTPSFKQGMYAGPVKHPFVWSSDRQRQAYFASDGFGHGIPYSRTNNLANSGTFRVNETSFWVEYDNTAPYAKHVIHPSYQIAGHRATGWKGVNTYVVQQSGKIVPIFKRAALDAWDQMNSLMYGGGFGL